MVTEEEVRRQLVFSEGPEGRFVIKIPSSSPLRPIKIINEKEGTI